MHRRRVIDAVAHETDDMSHFLKRQNDSFFLIGIYFDEEVRLLGGSPQSFVMDIVQLGSRQDAIRSQPDKSGDVLGDKLIVPRDDLHRYPEPCQISDGFR